MTKKREAKVRPCACYSAGESSLNYGIGISKTQVLVLLCDLELCDLDISLDSHIQLKFLHLWDGTVFPTRPAPCHDPCWDRTLQPATYCAYSPHYSKVSGCMHGAQQLKSGMMGNEWAAAKWHSPSLQMAIIKGFNLGVGKGIFFLPRICNSYVNL